jgi:hypothetical protein
VAKLGLFDVVVIVVVVVVVVVVVKLGSLCLS